MNEKQFKQSCKCLHCGNEAEMVITCALPENTSKEEVRIVPKEQGDIRGESVCTHCGNEAEIWLSGI